MKKIISLALAMLLILSCFAGCGNKEEQTGGEQTGTEQTGGEKTEEKKVKDTVVLVTDEEPETLDPQIGNKPKNNIAQDLIFDSLVTMDYDKAEYVPRLATKWEVIDDTHVRFYLREGVKFSNGNDFNAEDVLYCLGRCRDIPTAKSTMEFYDPDTSYAENDYTVVLSFHYPYAPYLNVLCGGRTWIGDKETMEQMGEDAYARAPIGTGAYTLESWTTGATMSLKRNENYWGEAAKTENVVFNYIAEPTGRVIALETGEADFAYYINGSDVARVNDLDGFHVEQGPSCKYYTICLNMKNGMFADARLREAMSLAIDLEALAYAGFDGTAKVMQCALPSTVEGSCDIYGENGGWKYDPEAAKALVKEAGAEGMEFELHVQPTAEFLKLAQIVKGYWDAIGLNCHIEQSETSAREAQGPWEASIRNGNANEVTGILIIYESTFGSRVGNNDDKLDEMLVDLQKTYDTQERLDKIRDLMEYIYEIRYTIPFAEVNSIFGVGDHIEGYEFTYQISHQNIADWVVYE